jgi:hypothetical protein
MYLTKLICKKAFGKIIFFVGILKDSDEQSRIRIRRKISGTNPRIRIRTKMSRIPNADLTVQVKKLRPESAFVADPIGMDLPVSHPGLRITI